MRHKIKFEKLKEISMEEIQGGENGELNKLFSLSSLASSFLIYCA